MNEVTMLFYCLLRFDEIFLSTFSGNFQTKIDQNKVTHMKRGRLNCVLALLSMQLFLLIISPLSLTELKKIMRTLILLSLLASAYAVSFFEVVIEEWEHWKLQHGE